MRLRIHVFTAARHIPWDEVLRPGRALGYHLMGRGDAGLAERMHADGIGGVAPFGHGGVVFPAAPRRPGVYAAGGPGYVELGTPRRDVAVAILRGLDGIEYIDWGGVALRVNRAEVLPPPDFSAGVATWETTTPICVRTGPKTEDRFLLPGEPGWEGCLGRNSRTKARVLGLNPAVSVDLVRGRGRRRFMTCGAGWKMGAPAVVRVKAEPRVLAALWCWGLGQQTSGGFGWVAAGPQDGRQWMGERAPR